MSWEERAKAVCVRKARAMDAGAVKFSTKGKAGARVLVASFAHGWRFECSEKDTNPIPRIAKRPTDPKPDPKPEPKPKAKAKAKAKPKAKPKPKVEV
jgi:outer membrane biosynthesis protein TonB